MTTRSEYLQVRVSPAQKAALKRRAADAGMDMSTYVLTTLLPTERSRFEAILVELADESARTPALAELNDLLTAVPPRALPEVVEGADVSGLSEFTKNYVAAMVEHACRRAGIDAPAWTARVTPLEEPYFAAPLAGLRPHLLKTSPVAFKRRNIFIDATLGDRV